VSEFLSRSYECDISVRSEAGGRTIYGIIVPFERVARVSDGGPFYDEAFQRGAFSKHLAERQKPLMLLSQHRMDRDPLGRSTLLREDSAGLYGEFFTFDTTKANDALNLAAEGALSFSIGFRGIKYEKRSGVVWRTEAGVREASLVTYPAYEDAMAAVRSLSPEATADELREALAAFPTEVAARALADLTHLSATTPDGEPERSAEEPVKATPGDSPTEASAKQVIEIQRARIFTT
jgi:HK97 family phage prohead protease